MNCLHSCAGGEAARGIDDVADEVEPVEVIEDNHVEGKWWSFPLPYNRGHGNFCGWCGDRSGDGLTTDSRDRRK